ncbi:MAG: glycosyltransferase family 2 protein [Candidatus Accumulibacter sp.]|jgi:predicted LPLAT superfamily acyltransferase|nr:glycosyltransferase family 2 protein [Accumulibacter sp.]
MNFRYCFLIPVFNHWKSIRATVESLSARGLDVYLIDDGSDAQTQAVLKRVAEDFPSARLFRLPENRGKGAALMLGMREAARAGFTHALQVDADGQHDLDDVPRFLALSKADPAALVCGRPVYDESIPRKRLYGRRVTHFWVGVETLSFHAPDSMCGFRVYPLARALRVVDRVRLPERMNFDVEILVRMLWDGVPAREVSTRVVYPPDGISHFDLIRDNLRISWTHVRLFAGMLPRIPPLLFRKFSTRRRARHWSDFAERGCGIGTSFFFAMYRFFGERTARLFVYPLVAYFFVTGRQAREASMAFLRRAGASGQGRAGPPALWASFRHMLSFGHALMDRLAAWAGEDFEGRIDFSDHAELARIAASKTGAVWIASHLGNIELMRAVALNEGVAVNAVVYTDHAPRFNTMLERANAGFGLRLVQVSRIGPETAILLKEKIDRGELVVIVGDRTPPFDSDRVLPIKFLGDEAFFAQGPFILSSLMACPVYLFFCFRQGERFSVHLERFADKIELPRSCRRARIESYMRRYVERLEYYCRMAPMEWFNFYDFWRRPDENGKD